MQPSTIQTDNLDVVTAPVDQFPFELIIAPYSSPVTYGVLRSADVALLSLDYHQTHLSRACRRLRVPCAYVTEYSLRTRIQIAKTERLRPDRLARRALWEIRQEIVNRKAVSIADAVFCNGTPTYRAYSRINSFPLLFFDTRTRASDLATESLIRSRSAAHRTTGKLRLAFSGRLIAMKGVDHLVQVARELRDLGRPFTLTVCGAGASEQSMRDYVAAHHLDQLVHFSGNLDFRTELLPFLKNEVDVFVSCHRQGDPSCTYLETMACGVPIAGYGNEAFSGLFEASGCGWISAIDRPKQLASLIASLSADEIERHSIASLQFASEHTFEREFARRSHRLHCLLDASRRRSPELLAEFAQASAVRQGSRIIA
jgi:glycosyltransferase involved in cell wall biosynthesis